MCNGMLFVLVIVLFCFGILAAIIRNYVSILKLVSKVKQPQQFASSVIFETDALFI